MLVLLLEWSAWALYVLRICVIFYLFLFIFDTLLLYIWLDVLVKLVFVGG